MTLTLEPIGYLRSNRHNRFLVPRQPSQPQTCRDFIELVPGRHLEVALSDLDGFSRIWLIWWFHKNSDWRPKVLPPRGRGRKGVLATRSPHRPNPLGLSSVPLLRVAGLKLEIGEHDLLDGTPILDIKPYLSQYDAFPEESQGWLADLECHGHYCVELSPKAQAQLNWLQQHHHPEFPQKVMRLLEADPMPHRTRRILRLKDGGYRLGCGPYRVFYRIEAETVRVERLTQSDSVTEVFQGPDLC